VFGLSASKAAVWAVWPVPPWAISTAVPFQTPEAIVPTPVMLAWLTVRSRLSPWVGSFEPTATVRSVLADRNLNVSAADAIAVVVPSVMLA
jgi:hypothetical protein